MNQIVSRLGTSYQIIGLLGEGGSGKTYRALDDRSQTEVAIKVLSLRGMGDWKTLELFDREAKILAQLNHPAIPRYLDTFQTEIAGEDAYCLVQAIAPGRTLTSWVESGYLFSESELQDIATQILDILIYLQTFTPPIIHRDLKPQNLLWSESGKLYLVDFGAVRDTYHLAITGGSTIVGTCGYMAPEQFRGQAVLATDLYGLGATLLYLKSGQDPADLPVKQMKIDFRSRVKTSPDFANWLERLLEPIPEDRYRNAAQALAALQGKAVAKIDRPKQPISQVSYRGEAMKIVIPPIWLATSASQKTFLTAMLLLLLAIAGWWIIRIAVLPGELWLPLLLFGTVIIPWMLRVLWHFCTVVICQHELEIVDLQAICQTKLGRISISNQTIKLRDIENVHYRAAGRLSEKGGIEFKISVERYYRVDYILGETKHLSLYSFGKYLDRAEQRWLMGEILAHIQYLDPHIDRN
ncbi:serine/threonine-protein kinase [Chamaesiphon sp. VAR_48_metabat_403]|uniref:serine/threonine protein kinase n=1 Tax=Chamaesiphon sp. VAR_48_metabat_403 TaxID=2964700 RepID=UPI00286DEF93|nr:serine/threonine-protein kinase [Chamaesiphon sp. VAR_48_metabat_403]